MNYAKFLRRSAIRVRQAKRLRGRGLTQDQIAEKMGISRQRVGQILKKKE